MRLRIAPIARALLLIAFSLVGSAAISHASGLNLAWTLCANDGGASNRNFACSSNTGGQVIEASFQNSSTITEPIGVEAVIDLQVADATLPPWWTQKFQGGCRADGAVNWGTVVNVLSSHCLPDLTDAGTTPLFGAPQPGFSAPNRIRWAIGYSLVDTTVAELPGGNEFFVLALAVMNRGTVGTSCTGCSTPACFVFNSLKIHRRDGLPDVVISNPGAHPYATWQGGAIGGLGCPAATPVRGTTWGVLKSMYR